MAESLEEKTVKGLAWTFLETFALNLFGFVQGVILARLLMPSDYGLISMTGIFFAVSYAMIDSGFSNALVRRKNHEAIDFSTVYVTNIVLSLFFALLLCACSSLIADFYNQPLLRQIVCVNALYMFLQSFIAVQGTRMSINLQFRQKSIINVTNTIIMGILSMVLAFTGYGVWSLIYPSFVGLIVKAVFFWHYQNWFPGLAFSWRKFREFFNYGSRLLASNLLDTTYNNIYPILIGKLYSAADLAYYDKARSYAALPATTTSGILAKVTFPVLAKVNDDVEVLRGVYRRMIRQSAFVVFPCMMGLSALARPLILLLITEKWAPAIPLLQVVCFSMMWYPIHALNLQLLMVRGRSDLFFRLEIIKKVVGLLVILVVWRYGVFWMCASGIFTSIVCLFINTYYTGKLIQFGFVCQMRDLAPALLCSLALFVFVFASISLFTSPWIQLIMGMLLGGTFYLALARLIHSQDLVYTQQLLRKYVLSRIHRKNSF